MLIIILIKETAMQLLAIKLIKVLWNNFGKQKATDLAKQSDNQIDDKLVISFDKFINSL